MSTDIASIMRRGSGEDSAPEEWLAKTDPKRIAWEKEQEESAQKHQFKRAQNAVRDLPSEKREKISDGYHSFKELYDHRIEIYIALCKQYAKHSPFKVWRTRIHSDGTSFEGWFVLGIGYDEGEQITYHLPLSRWYECAFAVDLSEAPEYDGHSSADVLERLKKL
jgi:hypothetical protein